MKKISLLVSLFVAVLLSGQVLAQVTASANLQTQTPPDTTTTIAPKPVPVYLCYENDSADAASGGRTRDLVSIVDQTGWNADTVAILTASRAESKWKVCEKPKTDIAGVKCSLTIFNTATVHNDFSCTTNRDHSDKVDDRGVTTYTGRNWSVIKTSVPYDTFWRAVDDANISIIMSRSEALLADTSTQQKASKSISLKQSKKSKK